jgi:hypothetical protein
MLTFNPIPRPIFFKASGLVAEDMFSTTTVVPTAAADFVLVNCTCLLFDETSINFSPAA